MIKFKDVGGTSMIPRTFHRQAFVGPLYGVDREVRDENAYAGVFYKQFAISCAQQLQLLSKHRGFRISYVKLQPLLKLLLCRLQRGEDFRCMERLELFQSLIPEPFHHFRALYRVHHLVKTMEEVSIRVMKAQMGSIGPCCTLFGGVDTYGWTSQLTRNPP